jgi:hypothetical protein
MRSEILGGNLIFLISQPRAGSTLLQRMLGGHREIHTASEPWLMLPPLDLMRGGERDADYSFRLAHTGLETFLATLPRGRAEYLDAVRRAYAPLYGAAIRASGKRCFLDKTPRYYFVIAELKEVFPEARFIILLRTPPAVLVSIVERWIERKGWFALHNYRHDLLRAPAMLMDGAEALGDAGLVVRFESLVAAPGAELARICAFLDVPCSDDLVDYGRGEPPNWRFGDKKSISEHARPEASLADRWRQSLEHPQTWRLARDYVHALGKALIARMGYSFEELDRTLHGARPSAARLLATVPLHWLLRCPPDDRSAAARFRLAAAGRIGR